jgi:hypothetical protein
MRRRLWRSLLLVCLAVSLAAVLIVAIAAWNEGWTATRNQLSTKIESALWPPLSRIASRLSPGAGAREREVWRWIIDGHSVRRDNRVYNIAVDPVAQWPAYERESRDDLQMRVVEGWAPGNQGTPAAAVALADFIAENGRAAFVDCGALPAHVRCVPHSEMDKHEREMDGWERFTQENGGIVGHLTLSRAGFNALHTVAVIYAGFSCGPLCGGGGYFVLKRENGGWKLVAYHQKWAS